MPTIPLYKKYGKSTIYITVYGMLTVHWLTFGIDCAIIIESPVVFGLHPEIVLGQFEETDHERNGEDGEDQARYPHKLNE